MARTKLPRLLNLARARRQRCASRGRVTVVTVKSLLRLDQFSVTVMPPVAVNFLNWAKPLNLARLWNFRFSLLQPSRLCLSVPLTIFLLPFNLCPSTSGSVT